MTSISGTLRVGEASAAIGKLSVRQLGSNKIYWMIMLGLVFGGLIVGLAVAFLLPNNGSHYYSGGASTGAIVGGFVYAMLQRPLVKARFRRRFQARHHTLDLPVRIEFTSDHLIYEIGGITQLSCWPAVDEVFTTHGYWIFLAQATALFTPRRFFANAEEERQFVSEALALMAPEARARSREAARFALAA